MVVRDEEGANPSSQVVVEEPGALPGLFHAQCGRDELKQPDELAQRPGDHGRGGDRRKAGGLRTGRGNDS